MPIKIILKGTLHNFLDCAVDKNILECIRLENYVCSE